MSRVFDTCSKVVLVAVLVHFPVGVQPGIRENRENQQLSWFSWLFWGKIGFSF